MNRDFLKKLKQKLQVCNTRSIHLNAYTGRLASRLDLFDLCHIKNSLPAEFLKKLLSSPSFSFRIKIDNQFEFPAANGSAGTNDNAETKKAAGEPAPEHAGAAELQVNIPSAEKELKLKNINKRLTSLLYENEDTYLEHGVRSFGFGYPILVYRSKQDPEKMICSPVFIWMMDITRDKNEWIISRDEDQSITVNDVLLNFLEQDLGSAGFVRLNDEYLADSLLDETEYTAVLNELLKQIDSNVPPAVLNYIAEQIPDKSLRSSMLKSKGDPFVHSGGVFGLFKSPKEPIINDIKQLIEKESTLSYDKLISDPFQKFQYSALETDPTQERALKSLKDNNRLIIHGPPGTGKSQTLTAIIVNALFNKAKCLVVCEKRTALDVILKNLTMLGLGGLCGLIEDVNRDRKRIVDAVRNPKPEVKPVREEILNELFKDTDGIIENVNKSHKFYGRFLLNDMTWSDLAGKFLAEKDDDENFLKLYNKLKNYGIDFASEALSEIYNSTVNAVKRNKSLFDSAKDDINTFIILNDRYFIKGAAKDTVIEIEKKAAKYLGRLNEVLAELEGINKKYSESLLKYYNEYYNSFSTEINVIANLYNKNSLINAGLFNNIGEWTNIKLAVISIFSRKYRQLKNDKAEITILYNKLGEYKEQGYFEFALPEIQNDMKLLQSSVGIIIDSLNNWYHKLNEFHSARVKEYSGNNYDRYVIPDNSELIKAAERAAEIISDLNSEELLNKKIVFTDDSLSSKLSTLKFVTENITLLLKDINNLYDYFYWRSDYLNNNDFIKKLIDTLIELKINNWNKEIELYLIFNILITSEKNISLRDESCYSVISGNMDKIKEYQLNIISRYWHARQIDSSKKLEERTGININALYNKSRNSKFQKRNSLRKIIAADFDVFTDQFPVLLVNPAVCASLFKMDEGMFDLVIFDEASQLKIEDVYSSKLRGRYRIVSGDENQMPPSSYFAASQVLIESDTDDEEEEISSVTDLKNLADSESLLEFAVRRGYYESYLDIHYRSKHPDLIAFSNAAFYGQRLNPMPPASGYKAIRYFNVCGIYNREEGINKQEAEKVISIINELVDPAKGEGNPSIGIATLNIFQRNYILDMINYESNRSSSFASKIAALNSKAGEPFFVKNLENIQGDERDVIIISTTFGKRPDGSFLQNYGPINQDKGFRLLNVIITRAKHMMIVCTSIPEEIIMEYPSLLAVAGNRGKAIFYAYLAYAKAVEGYDVKLKNSILEQVSVFAEETSKNEYLRSRSLFEEEVYKRLLQYFPSDKLVKNYKTGGFTIDIAVLPETPGGIITAIECDGCDMHLSEQAYAWDIFRQKYLERFGIRFIRTWSVNWFNNPGRELERLTESIAAHLN